MAPEERAAVGKLADLYAGRLDDFAELITAEMGSPITFSRLAQAPQPQMMLSYFAELGKAFTWEDDRQGLFGPVTVRREPVGVVAAIVPWNVPQFTIMTKLPAALVAGCTVVIKPLQKRIASAFPHWPFRSVTTNAGQVDPGHSNGGGEYSPPAVQLAADAHETELSSSCAVCRAASPGTSIALRHRPFRSLTTNTRWEPPVSGA